MARKSENQLKPRNGHTLIVGIVCRISGRVNQKEASLDAQEDNAKEAIADVTRRDSGLATYRCATTI